MLVAYPLCFCRTIDGGDNYIPFTNTSGTFLLPYYDETFFELDAQAGMTGWPAGTADP